MVNLLFLDDSEVLAKKGVIRTLYDPAAGTGGMLSVARELPAGAQPQRHARRSSGRNSTPSPTPSAEPTCSSRARTAQHQVRQQLHARRAARRDVRLLPVPIRPSAWSGRRSRRRPATSTRSGAGRPVRGRSTPDRRWLAPVPPAHDLEVQARTARAPGSPSSSTARRCSPATAARARARSAAGSSRTTGWKPSSPCPTSSSTTPASPPTSGSSPTASRRSRKGKIQLINATRFLRRRCGRAWATNERDRRRLNGKPTRSPRSPASTATLRRGSTPRFSTTRISATGGSPSSAHCGCNFAVAPERLSG